MVWILWYWEKICTSGISLKSNRFEHYFKWNDRFILLSRVPFTNLLWAKLTKHAEICTCNLIRYTPNLEVLRCFYKLFEFIKKKSSPIKYSLWIFMSSCVPLEIHRCGMLRVFLGNSVHADKKFLDKYMPQFMKHLHYRIIDVSTVKELCR